MNQHSRIPCPSCGETLPLAAAQRCPHCHHRIHRLKRPINATCRRCGSDIPTGNISLICRTCRMMRPQ